MKVCLEDKKKYNKLLLQIHEYSQRCLVSLRSENWNGFDLDLHDLAGSMMDMMTEASQEIMPIESLVSEDLKITSS